MMGIMIQLFGVCWYRQRSCPSVVQCTCGTICYWPRWLLFCNHDFHNSLSSRMKGVHLGPIFRPKRPDAKKIILKIYYCVILMIEIIKIILTKIHDNLSTFGWNLWLHAHVASSLQRMSSCIELLKKKRCVHPKIVPPHLWLNHVQPLFTK